MYRAPLKELRFVLHELIRDEQLAGLETLEDYSPDFADSVLDEAAKFAEDVLDPINAIGDREGAQWTADGVRMPQAFKDAYASYVAAGWTQLRGSAEYGGQGAPIVLGTAVEEMWASANLAFKLCPMLTQGAIEAIERCGSADQRQRYLPKMVAGEWAGTMNLTEPQAGTDLASIRTRAVPDGDKRYRLFGQKIFITYGDHDYTSNIVHMVLARIEGAPSGTRGISLFIVPKYAVNADGSVGAGNDVRCVSIEHKLGIHASPTCVMAYGDKVGAVGELVGEPNHGLEYMFIMMNAARLSVGLEGYALAERAYQRALEWARTRIQGRPRSAQDSIDGKPLPIAYHPDVKRMLLTMRASTDAARAIASYTALQMDLARRHGDAQQRVLCLARGELLIPIVKAWSTELGVTLTSLGIQVHGGMGFIEETGAAQHLRDARIATIYEGTTGVQAADLIGRKLARDDAATMRQLIAEMRESVATMTAGDAALAESVATTNEAIGLLEDATAAIMRAYKQAPQHALALSVPYLTLCGVVIGGWFMVRAHAIAIAKHAQDPEFYASKRQAARFYAQFVLADAWSLHRVMESGGISVSESDPTLF